MPIYTLSSPLWHGTTGGKTLIFSELTGLVAGKSSGLVLTNEVIQNFTGKCPFSKQ